MNISSSRPVDKILSLAVERGLLNRQDCDRLIREAECQSANPIDLAMEQSLLEGAQIEFLQALTHPDQFIPGYEILDSSAQAPLVSCIALDSERLDRIVALKTIDLRRFNGSGVAGRCQLEARVVASLSHPNIVTAYDYGVHEGRVYLAMELLDGETLQDRIDREGPLEEHLAWAIARQIAAGLAHAAEHEIVHRDIKPANIILVKPNPGMEGPPGVPLAKITDFGLALQLNSLELTRLTATGTLLGTLAYAAPEQLDEPNVDSRADIFAARRDLIPHVDRRRAICDSHKCFERHRRQAIRQRDLATSASEQPSAGNHRVAQRHDHAQSFRTTGRLWFAHRED